jgi:4-hydroxybenzoate polyprenyltransferase
VFKAVPLEGRLNIVMFFKKQMNILPYIRIARPDNWFKNIFVVPGILLAYYFSPETFSLPSLFGIVVGFISACLIASSNYVINEILDAPTDRLHPVKHSRPIPSGQANIGTAYWLWAILAVIGIGTAFLVNQPFGLMGLFLWIMGLLYNVHPVRLKEWPYADVLSEALNNPIRLALGWFSTGLIAPPPLSMIMAYWMFGAYLMAVKRLAEFREFGDPQAAAAYRRSFGWYNQERLLVSILFYAAFFGMTSGVFIIRYRFELVLATPVVAACLAYYLHIGFRKHSAAQYPENLYRERKLMLLVLLSFILCVALLFCDLAPFRHLFTPIIPPPAHELT